jgi:nucleoid-associated protein YgaU
VEVVKPQVAKADEPAKQPPPEVAAQPTEPAAPATSPFVTRPPQLPAEFPREAVPPAAAAIGGPRDPNVANAAPPSVDVAPRDSRTTLARPAPRERLHVVRDGDTLSKLAERYLGDSRRRMEIFADNRQLLQSPDVLPIGAKLRIVTGPPRIVETVVDAPQGAPPAASQPGPVVGNVPASGPRPLVPLPPGAFADRKP